MVFFHQTVRTSLSRMAKQDGHDEGRDQVEHAHSQRVADDAEEGVVREQLLELGQATNWEPNRPSFGL